jgi:suppressor of ftsI/bilirubin oxidase
MRTVTRRRLLAAATAGAAGLAWWRIRPTRDTAPTEPATTRHEPLTALALPGEHGLMGIVDAAQPFNVSARAMTIELAPGMAVPMLIYEIEQAGQTYLNPVLRIRRGAVLQTTFWNQLEQTSIIHWHGLRVDANNDGNPHYAVGPGEIYDYRIALHNRAATCWYHPHPHHLSAGQIYRGLASFLIVEDEDEDKLARHLDLNLGTTDLPLLIQDRRIDRNHRFVRALDLESHFLGHLGSEAMVNYTRDAQVQFQQRIYRLRLLNASSARILRLAFIHADKPLPFHIIGTDGGLLQQPIESREAFLAPGERLDVLLDTHSLAVGSQVVMRSLAFDAMRDTLAQLCISPPPTAAPVNEHAMPAAAVSEPITAAPKPIADGAPLDVLRIHIQSGPRYERSIPATLCAVPRIDVRGARVRRFDLDHDNMQWRINGIRFEMLKTPVLVERGTVEIWEIHNPPGGMPHPMHFHGFSFRLLSRQGSPEQVRRNALGKNGLAAAETGWKDTVLVWPGERVRLALDFSHDYPGEQVYMLHCHNLEHEDQGMMLNVRIVPPGRGTV